MTRTQIYLTRMQALALRKLAQKRKQTLSGVIRMFIGWGLEKTGHRRAAGSRQTTLLKTLEKVSRLGKRGPADLATHLDEYLYGGK